MFYLLHGIQLESSVPLESFEPFLSDKAENMKTVVFGVSDGAFCAERSGYTVEHKHINITKLDEGWLYSFPEDSVCELWVSDDYSEITAYNSLAEFDSKKILPLLRTALECAAAEQGSVSLHSSCIKLDGKALCFTANSGVGKSTRALNWVNVHGAELLSGDRPMIKADSSGIFACGVPWDGKEQIFVNDCVPLAAICDIRRGETTRVRRLSFNQARRVLAQQCFIPMWDIGAAGAVMALISKLCRETPVYRVICGIDEESTRKAKEIIFHRNEEIAGIEDDMKIKNGFVLKNIAGENIVMPAGSNIGAFDGAIVLNEVAAFIWSKMEESVSRNELLGFILSEFDVEEEKAAADLDALISKLSDYGVIEQETT
ncbi:MAG: PqqD family peptide modification chaperone [Clostridia bacterium]|nr:PqqD family peptide modification chaperone [Clostridia bacterium]